MKILFLLLVSVSCFAQDVIDFKLLFDKRVKSTTNYTVSDNSIDFKNIDHKGTYYVRLIGEYPKRLVLKNMVGGTIVLDGGVSSASDNKTLQVADCKRVTLDFTNGKVTGNGLASTGVCGQLIYIYGKWQNITIKGGLLHQNGKSGGAAFQVESYSDPNFNHGKLVIDGLTVTKAMGEGIYINYNQPTKAYLDTLEIRNTNISNTRRDFWQLANVRTTLIEDNKGDNGGLEMNPDHVSGFSLGGKNGKVVIRNNVISRVPQLLFSGTQSNIDLENNTYNQGDHAGNRANQAIYTKSPMTLKRNNINAPAALAAIITADGATVNWDVSNMFNGPKLFRFFNGGKSVESAVVIRSHIETVEERTSTGSNLWAVMPDGTRVLLK